MGGRAQVLVVGPPGLVAVAEARVAELEDRWSRFLPDSDVSRANASPGRPVSVHRDTLELARAARQAHRETGGAFDPLLGRDLEALGYDRPFVDIDPDRPPTSPPSRRDAPLAIDVAASTLTVPIGRSFDAGGIAKGLAADLTVETLLRAGADGALVNLGGDLRVSGTAPSVDGWVVSIDHPLEEEGELVRVVLADGAIASSSRLHRAWGPEEDRVHHLVDPATGRPVDNGVVGVTVFAATGWRAEAFTKAAFLAGPEEGIDVLEDHGLDGVVVRVDGSWRATSRVGSFLV